ncbi:hypothetical protein DPMN_145366 [Dreissena polymorpha]|uniref:B box-type domain-containing protein n=2 Tax=Dreissena polymorpha TaxID=45954 RepID=A0A9D4F3V1_DREPO|nr:hypothetical protein DPMN_145366 [Dreissena polymorpha]
MFCQDHSKLCCSDCVLLNHRQCTDLALIAESVKTLSVDMQQLSSKIQEILAELNHFTKTQEASIQSMEGSYNEKLQEIREQRKTLNAALDKLENTTLKELDEIRTILQTSLKKDVDNCSRLKHELQQLSEAVQGLHDKNNKEMEFVASMKCQDKIHESESYLNENSVQVQSTIIFMANINIEQYLFQQASLGRIVDSMAMNPDTVLTVKRKSQSNIKIPKDSSDNCNIRGICSLPSGQVIVADSNNTRVKMFDKYYNLSSLCDVSGFPWDICLISSSEVAVTLDSDGVQFMSVSNGQLANGRKLQLPHNAVGIAHHHGALYITSNSALYHYTLNGTLVKKLYEDGGGYLTVYKCAVSPAVERIYVTNFSQHTLITLATDGTLISTFTDPELRNPEGVCVTTSGQVIVCGCVSHTVIQVDHEGRKKQATLLAKKDGMTSPLSISYNTYINHIIVGLAHDNYINLIELE